MALGLAQQDNVNEQSRDKYLQRCQLEVTRLDQMISDVLSLSRLENATTSLHLETLDFDLLITNIVADEQFVADKKRITINVIDSTRVAIAADNILLASAISNILSNAVKYSPDNSTIEVSLTTDKQQLMLLIEDQGAGVPEQALNQLFQPFYRVSEARDRQTGGTGLGLAIAKQAIIAHKGQICAKNIYADNTADAEDTATRHIVGLLVSIKLPLNLAQANKVS